MDREVKRLLKLSKIPGFQLSAAEEQFLDEWKASQKRVRTPRKKKTVEATEKPVEAVVEPETVVDTPAEETSVTNALDGELKTFGEIREA